LVGLIITGTIEAVHDPSEAALKSAVNAQYFFILLSIIAIAVAWILMKSSDRNPGLMLDVPNKKR
jgi:tetrahydromethanopterin S-methyltransferase subunit D